MKNNGYGTTDFQIKKVKKKISDYWDNKFQIKKVKKKFRTIFLEFNLRIDQ